MPQDDWRTGELQREFERVYASTGWPDAEAGRFTKEDLAWFFREGADAERDLQERLRRDH